MSARDILYGDLPLMLLKNGAGNGKAKTGAVGKRVAGPEEAFAHAWQLSFGNAGPVVND